MASYLHTLDRFGTCGLVDGSYVCPYHAVVTLDELDIYGSTRLGTYEPAQNLIATYDVMLGYKEFKIPVYDTVTNIVNLTIPEADTFSTHLGQKKYELTDHLGNVITTISDRKLEIAYSDTLTNYTMPDVIASQDYYAFGMQMPGRIYQSDDYRFGFNGMEQDEDMKGEGNSLDFGARIYDSRLGRWLSLDPLFAKYPNLSAYNMVNNNPFMNREKDGKDYDLYIDHETKTITVRASYYSQSNRQAENDIIRDAVTFWNAQSGRFQYKVGKGKNAEYYDVNIELSANNVVYNQGNYPMPNPDEPTSNSVHIVPNLHGAEEQFRRELPADERENTVVNVHGINVRDQVGVTEADRDNETVARHEVGHGLGMRHKNGIMTEGNTGQFKKATRRNVSDILARAGVGRTAGRPGWGANHGQAVRNQGSQQNAGFLKGKLVRSKER